MKIHPDRHQSNSKAQAANSKVLSLITQLFQSDPPESPPQLHPLCFYLKETEQKNNLLCNKKSLKIMKENDYFIINYALLHQIPFTSASLQSALNLFSAVGIDCALMTEQDKDHAEEANVNSTTSGSLLQSNLSSIQHDFHLTKQELSSLQDFLSQHPNVIAEASDSHTQALLSLLQPTIEGITRSSLETPLFIFSPAYHQPSFDSESFAYHLPATLNAYPSNLRQLFNAVSFYRPLSLLVVIKKFLQSAPTRVNAI